MSSSKINTNPNAVSIETVVPELVRHADLMNFGFKTAAQYEKKIIPGQKFLGKVQEIDFHDSYCINRFLGLAMVDTPTGLKFQVLFFYDCQVMIRRDLRFQRMTFTSTQEQELIRDCKKLIPFMQKAKSYRFVDDADGVQFDFYIQIGTLDDGNNSPVFWVCDNSRKSGDDLGNFDIWDKFLEDYAKELDSKYRYVYLVSQDVKEENSQTMGIVTLNQKSLKTKTLCSVQYGYTSEGQFKIHVKTDFDDREELNFANKYYLVRKDMPDDAISNRLQDSASHIMNYVLRLGTGSANKYLKAYLVCRVGGRMGLFNRSPEEFDEIVQAINRATQNKFAFFIAKPAKQ